MTKIIQYLCGVWRFANAYITRENRKEIIKTMNKEKYEVPVMEIVEFETEDVITTSGDLDEGDV